MILPAAPSDTLAALRTMQCAISLTLYRMDQRHYHLRNAQHANDGG